MKKAQAARRINRNMKKAQAARRINRNMKKAQVARRINRVFKEYNRILVETLNETLKDADMWYGDQESVDEWNPEDRNGGLLVSEGPITGGFGDFSSQIANYMLHTRKELGFPPKEKRSARNNSRKSPAGKP